MNLTFASFNIGMNNNSFVRYRLAYNLQEFFEIRFRFIAQPIEQKNGLLMFMSHISTATNTDNNNSEILSSSNKDIYQNDDFVSLVYMDKILQLKLNIGQGLCRIFFIFEFTILIHVGHFFENIQVNEH